MQWAPDSPDLWAPDSGRPRTRAPDSFEHLTLGRAVDLFLGAKAAEDAAPKTITWYRMILARAVRAFGADLPVDRLTGPDLRAWLLELRTTLAPVSVAGYLRTLKVLGNWLLAELLAEAAALRALRKPRVPTSSSNPSPTTRFDGCSGSPPCARGRSSYSSSTRACGCPRRPACASATCGRMAR